MKLVLEPKVEVVGKDEVAAEENEMVGEKDEVVAVMLVIGIQQIDSFESDVCYASAPYTPLKLGVNQDLSNKAKTCKGNENLRYT
jgi:hypothetical protein